jgi:hypothetical protein
MTHERKKVRVLLQIVSPTAITTFSEQGVIVLRSGELSSKATKRFFRRDSIAISPLRILRICDLTKPKDFLLVGRMLELSPQHHDIVVTTSFRTDWL